MGDAACNFALDKIFNAKYDITWSFQYSLCGVAESTGGFSTFLYDSSSMQIFGGGIRSGLGVAPYIHATDSYSGVNSLIVAAGFDSTGVFSSRDNGLVTGSMSPLPNSYTVRVGGDYLAKEWNAMPFDVLQPEEKFTAMRFNLTNLGQTLNIDYRKSNTSPYTRIASVETDLLFTNDTFCRIGVSYTSPITGTNQAIFKIKDIHTHGVS